MYYNLLWNYLVKLDFYLDDGIYRNWFEYFLFGI